MSLSPVPDRLFILPTNSFSIPAPRPTEGDTDPEARINLRVQVKVGILLPSSLVCAKPRKKWGIERNFDVVLPLGGKVDVGVRVKEEGLGLLAPQTARKGGAGVGAQSEGEHRLEMMGEIAQDMAQTGLKNLLRSNRDTLALKRITLLPNALHSIDESDESRASFTAFSLQCLTADTAHSPLVNNHVAAGAPVAHLQRMEVTLGWYRPKGRLSPSTNESSASSPHLHVEKDGTAEDAVDEIEVSVRDEVDLDDLIDDDHVTVDGDPGMVMHDDEDDAVANDDCDIAYYEANPPTQELSPDLNDSEYLANRISTAPSLEAVHTAQSQLNDPRLVPKWAEQQIEAGLKKLLRFHFIKRFPLIFDGARLLYNQKLSVPKALGSSLSRFINTSERYHTSLKANALHTLHEMWGMQEYETGERVRALIEMVSRKHGTPPPNSDESQENQGRKRKRTVTAVDPKEQVRQYVKTVLCGVREQVGWKKGSHEGLIRWILRDAAMRIGRAEWGVRRAGAGKMGTSRIPLILDSDNPDGQEEEGSLNGTQDQAADLDLRALLVSQDPYDDLITDEADEGELDDGYDDLESLIDDDHNSGIDALEQDDVTSHGGGMIDGRKHDRPQAIAESASSQAPTDPSRLTAQERLDQHLACEAEHQESIYDTDSILDDEADEHPGADDDCVDIVKGQAKHEDPARFKPDRPRRYTVFASSRANVGVNNRASFQSRPLVQARSSTTRDQRPNDVYTDYQDLLEVNQDGPQDDEKHPPDENDSDLLEDSMAVGLVDDCSTGQTSSTSSHERNHGDASNFKSTASSTFPGSRSTDGYEDNLWRDGQDAIMASDEEISYGYVDVLLLPPRPTSSAHTTPDVFETDARRRPRPTSYDIIERDDTPPLVPDDAVDDLIDDGNDEIIDDSEGEEPEGSDLSLGVLFPFHRAETKQEGHTGPDGDGFDWTPRDDGGLNDAGPASVGYWANLESVF